MKTKEQILAEICPLKAERAKTRVEKRITRSTINDLTYLDRKKKVTNTLDYLGVILKKEVTKSRRQSIIDKAKHKASLIEFKKNYVRTFKNDQLDILNKCKTHKKNRDVSRYLFKKQNDVLANAA